MRMRSTLALALVPVAGVFSPAPAHAEIPETLLTSPLAELWGAPPTINRPRLSPDGSKLLFMGQNPEGLGVVLVLDFANDELTTVGIGTEQAYDFGWCEWGNENRVLCDLAFAMNADGSETLQITPGRLRRPREHSGVCGPASEARATEITMDWLPEDPEHVIRTCGGSTRYNVYTGLIEPQGIGFGRDLRGTLMSNGHNFTRLQRYRDMQGPFDRWLFRNEMGGEWIQIHEGNPIELDDPFRPIGFGQNLNALFHLAWNSGRWGLYGIDLGGDLRSQHVYTHPLFDIELADTMGAYDRVVAVAWLDGRPQRYVVDQRVAAVYQAAHELFPEQNIEVVDESWDGNFYLLLVREPRRAGSYYLLEMAEGAIAPLGAEHAQLTDVELAETRSVSFEGADGGTIAGHLTLPPNAEGPVPAVVMPRGLPSRLDIADPHYLVQFLAASGYAVLRVNQRGNPEYGGWLAERTVLGWRQAAADVNDASRYLVAEGIAAPGRVCAVGRDVGAYAALVGEMEYPDALACIVTIGGIADPGGAPGVQILSTLGREFSDMLRDGSPIRRDKDIQSPVLILHGAYDGVVSMFTHSLELFRSLDGRDTKAQFIEYEHGRHEIERRPYRVDMLTRIGNFLAENIGG